jgi:hypothetical protein
VRLPETLLMAASMPERSLIVRTAATAAFVLCAVALALHSTAQSATGMSAMQYYVGSWACTGGTPGKMQVHATINYTLDNGLLRQWTVVPAQSGMKTPYAQSASMTYDAKHNRYVSVGIDSGGGWDVTYVTINGNVETGIDHVTQDGKLGHGVTHRVNNSTFTYTGYPTLTSTTADFEATCHRS